MTLALPIWEQRVSPVFDVAGHLLLVDVIHNQVARQRIEPLPGESPARLAATLAAWQVELVICGAVSQALEQLLRGRGIRVIARIRGPVDQVIDAYLDDRLHEPQFSMPGCREAAGAVPGAHAEPAETNALGEQVQVRRVQPEARPAGHGAEPRLQWVAEADGREVGRLGMRIGDDVAEIDQLGADSTVNGMAVRCRLVQSALTYCRSRGLLKVILRAPTHSPRALGLFQCLGFQHSRSRDAADGPRMEFYLNFYKPVDPETCDGAAAGSIHPARES